MSVTYPPNNRGTTEPQTLRLASTEHPVDPDMPKLAGFAPKFCPDLTPTKMILWAVVKQYPTVMADMHEWMIRHAECDSEITPAVPVWKATFDATVAQIGEIENVVYSDVAADVLTPMVTDLARLGQTLRRDIFAALTSAAARPAGSRVELCRIALDDVALRALGYLSIAQLLCEEFELPTDPSSSAGVVVEGRESKGYRDG